MDFDWSDKGMGQGERPVGTSCRSPVNICNVTCQQAGPNRAFSVAQCRLTRKAIRWLSGLSLANQRNLQAQQEEQEIPSNRYMFRLGEGLNRRKQTFTSFDFVALSIFFLTLYIRLWFYYRPHTVPDGSCMHKIIFIPLTDSSIESSARMPGLQTIRAINGGSRAVSSSILSVHWRRKRPASFRLGAFSSYRTDKT